jgi:phosphoglycerate dehydrogenase-like enzyme
MTNILITLDPKEIPQSQIERIRLIVPDARLFITGREDEMQPLLGEVEIIAGHFPIPWISQAPRLQWYQQWGAGTDWLMKFPEVARLDFTLTNASGVHAIPISEHILAMMLAFARRLPQAIRNQEQRRWDRDGQPEAFELSGTTMLLVGVGAIGQRTAQIASGLGVRVIGVRHDKRKTVQGIEKMLGPDELMDALPEADFVVLTMPLTAETRRMINAQVFEKMKSSAYLINIGRGGTVDEAALIQALQDGQIAGAGLDVFATEPLPPTSPLWGMENVIITAHYSGLTPHYNERALEIFIDNLDRYIHHLPMRNVVDKQRGY